MKGAIAIKMLSVGQLEYRHKLSWRHGVVGCGRGAPWDRLCTIWMTPGRWLPSAGVGLSLYARRASTCAAGFHGVGKASSGFYFLQWRYSLRSVVRYLSGAAVSGGRSARAALPLTLPSVLPLSQCQLPVKPADDAAAANAKGVARPCCAFGYDPHAELLGLPVPFYQLNNVVTVDSLGIISTTTIRTRAWQNLIGLTVRITVLCIPCVADFIDTAHVRDTADMICISSANYYQSWGAFTLNLGEELAGTASGFYCFYPPVDGMRSVTRWPLAVGASGVPCGGVARKSPTRYGFESVRGFSEEYRPFRRKILF